MWASFSFQSPIEGDYLWITPLFFVVIRNLVSRSGIATQRMKSEFQLQLVQFALLEGQHQPILIGQLSLLFREELMLFVRLQEIVQTF